MVREMYVTISVFKKSYEDARTYFRRVTTDLTSHFARLGARCTPLDTTERLRILHDFYRLGEEVNYTMDLTRLMKRGHDFKDYICPDSFELKKIILKWETVMDEFYF